MKEQLVRELESALNNNNFSAALQLGARLINAYPNDPDSYILAGDTFSDMENWSKAIENYEKALAIAPNDPGVYFKLGEAYELQGDLQAAMDQFQVARKLEPSNLLYTGHFGRILHEKGRQTNNVNLIKEGLGLMENAAAAGQMEKIIREQLAIAYLEDAHSNWRRHPELIDKWMATELEHLVHTKNQIEKAKSLIDTSNPSINQVILEFESSLIELEKREFCGYKYLLKAPAIVGGILLITGNTGFGILLLLMAGLYYVSQLKPGYLQNRLLYKNDYRDPFIIRRLDAMSRELGGITWWTTSFTDLILFRFFFRLVFGAIRYMMVIVMLPYEILKGFWINFELAQKVMKKAERQPAYN